MTDTAHCPCGSGSAYSKCCQPYVAGKKKAPTAEALLRSRYSAFVKGEIDYILDTHHTKTKDEVKREGIEEWSRNSEWLGLEIGEIEGGAERDSSGTIKFVVKYRVNGKEENHREKSLFEKEHGEWRFLDALAAGPETVRRAEPKVGRNDPCPCGSGKKHKKCCG